VKALIGRTFAPEEDRTPNSHPVAVIGYGLWQRRFGSDTTRIGQTITLNDHDFTIIGVTAADFESPFAGNAIECVDAGDDEGLRSRVLTSPSRIAAVDGSW